MNKQLLERAAELTRRGESFALAVVVRREPYSSSQQGDMAIITADGSYHGWLGGNCTRPSVQREAAAALVDGKPRLISLSPEPDQAPRAGVTPLAMTCHSGGTVDIFIEPVLAAPRLVVFGVSPVARAVAQLGKAMGYLIDVVDPDAHPAELPNADRVFTDLAAAELLNGPSEARDGRNTMTGPSGARGDTPEVLSARNSEARDGRNTMTGPAAAYAVVASMGEHDEDAVATALAMRPAYLGVVASRKRFAILRQTLLDRGVSAHALDAIRSPAGLDLGGRQPEEVALSILAEIVQRKHAARTVEAAPAQLAPATSVTPITAIDPVCHMTVTVATARHVGTWDGRTWYFCNPRCKDKFLADPSRYLEPSSSGAAR
jgi:xanthine dehydrogenase accessory factor